MKQVLFVCLGNICRSPAAEGVMQTKVKKAGLEEFIKCDSCATSSFHIGEKADSRMREFAKKRGHDLLSLARQFCAPKDFERFDYIIVMDRSNYQDIMALTSNNIHKEKIFLMTDFCSKYDTSHVPDPYYGGDEGFNLVLDILEDATEGLLSKIKQESRL